MTARPPVVDLNECVQALRWARWQMEQRFRVLEQRGLRQWSELTPALPRIVIVVDELANVILSQKAVEEPLVAIASMGRAAGVHLVLATQRPSADVLTGLLRANIPARVALTTVTAIESRIIIESR